MVATPSPVSRPDATSKDAHSNPIRRWGRTATRLAWLPIPVLLAAIIILRVLDLHQPHENRYLLIVLNFVFPFLVSLFVAYLVARSFLKRATPGLLMLGCGMVALALSGSVGIVTGLSGDPSSQHFANITITIQNLMVCLSALCHMIGALLARRPRSPMRPAGLWLIAGYAAVTCAAGLTTLATLSHWTPVFFIQGQGGTWPRHLVLASAIVMFAFSGILLRRTHERRLSTFSHWYSLALLLLAVGLLGVTIQESRGEIVGWIGRMAQFLGGSYILVAAIASVHEVRAWELPLAYALKREQEFVSAILETAAALIVVLDTGGRIVSFNRRCEEVTGYRSTDVKGRPFWDMLLTPEDARKIKAYYHTFLTGDYPRTSENAWLTRDGRQRMIAWSNTVLHNMAGQVEHIIATGIDITERQRAQDLLRKSEERLKLSLDAGRMATWDWHVTAGEVTWNDTHFLMLGYRVGEVEPSYEAWASRMHPEDRAQTEAVLKRAMVQGGDYSTEFRALWPDGTVRWVETRGRFERDATGIAVRSYGVMIDVTERRQAENALRDNEQRLRQAHDLLELITGGTAVIIAAQDTTYRYTYFNEAYRDEIRRLTGKELHIGDNMIELFAHMPQERLFAIAEWSQAMRGESTNKIIEFGDPGRRRRWFQVLHTPIRDAEGGVVGVGEVAYDFTERVGAEQALRESEARFHALAEALPQIVWTAGAEGGIEWFNQRWYEYTGLQPGTSLGWSWRETAHAGDLPHTLEKWQEARRFAGVYENEIRVRRHDGEYRWFLVRAWPLRDPEGNVVRWFGTNTDIHDLKAAEAALRESRKDQDHAQAVGQIGSWRLDVGQNVLTWSDENHRIFGIPKGTPLSYETFLGTIHPDDRQYVDQKWQAGLAGEPYDIEHRIVVDGKVKWVREKAYLEFENTDKLLGGFGITQDITERKRAEEAVRRSEKRFKLLSDTSGRLLATQDPQGLIGDLCSEVMEHLDCQAFINFLLDEPAGRLRLNACTGIPVEEVSKIEWLDYGGAICGCVARDGHRIIAEDIQNTADARTALVRSFGIQAYCCHPLTVQGRVIGTLSFGTRTRVRFADDEVELMQTVADQVATAMQRIRAEQALRQANEQLEQRVQERTVELAQRASQLRALAGELTLSEQRERRRMAKVLHDHLQQLLVGAKFRVAILSRNAEPLVKQASDEIERLLDEAIGASRSLTAELSPPILHEGGLPGGLAWLARWMADKHSLTVDLSIEKGIPNPAEDIKILFFESVRELLFNAVKHAHVHAATVNLRIIDGNKLQIVVYNAGQGFDPTALKPAGTEGGGYGLFSIRERLALIGGKLDIVSAPGEGSRFTLVAPLGESATAPPVPASVAVPPGRIADKSVSMIIRKPGAGIRVLLVDDHAVMRQGLTRLLEAVPDIEVVGEAADGLEAVELARELAPEVVLMDLSLPKVNGIDATRMIHAARPEIRIIGLSMFEEPQQAQAMIDAGAVAYLTKSGPAESLIAAIRNCIAGS